MNIYEKKNKKTMWTKRNCTTNSNILPLFLRYDHLPLSLEILLLNTSDPVTMRSLTSLIGPKKSNNVLFGNFRQKDL